ncbi:MAG TPA: bifunctional nicotinamidase/pyrazinamidase [Planctomycetaceae bacterium]|nr:bifunctional nicotinamidase/pyrazinamidase [Planctomycetaceae bacterium]
MNGDAIILTDIQNDFLPGGALAVPEGDTILPLVNRLIEVFPLVVATQDCHPVDHMSFARTHGRRVGEVIRVGGVEQILWPVHCVEGTPGVELAPGLNKERIAKIVLKGTDREIDSYSTFFNNEHRRATGLDAFLRSRGVRRVYLCGLATDYCVKFSALDAARLRYQTFVVLDACRGIDASPGDVDRAVAQMKAAGVGIVAGEEVLAD